MALQTGNTTRIGDTGQLQNISSLDSTTSATILSSVGGGGWSRRTTGGFANSAICDITFPSTGGYSREYLIIFPKIKGSNEGTNLTNLINMRMFDSGNNLMSTSGDYKGFDNGQFSNSDTARSEIPITAGMGWVFGQEANGFIHFHNNPTSSQTRTMINFNFAGTKSSSGGLHTTHGVYCVNDLEATYKFRLYTVVPSWSEFTTNSSNFEIWGLDL